MKKVVVLLLVLAMAASVFAANIVNGVYDSTTASPSFTSGDGAKLPVTLNLTSGASGTEKIVVGFSSTDVGSISATNTPVTSATLTPVTGADENGHEVGTAYLKDQNVYLFYQIQSANNYNINVSTNALAGTSGSLNWKVSNAEGETELSIGGTDGSVSYTPKTFSHVGTTSYSSFDSIKLEMETASYLEKPADNYSAEITVKVESVGAGA